MNQGNKDIRSRILGARKTGRINISQRGLESLPPELTKIQGKIDDKDDNWWEAVALRKLDACMNEIREIPSDIAKLSNLEHLNLMRNRISALPEELFALKNL